MTDFGFWILDKNHQPVKVAGILEWSEWFHDFNNRRVAQSQWPEGPEVSTVFLGQDHNWSKSGPPLLFETMIFWPGHTLDEAQERYSTWDEAVAGHDAACTLVARAIREAWRR